MLFPSLTRLALALPLFGILLILSARCTLCFILPFFMFDYGFNGKLVCGMLNLLIELLLFYIKTQILEQDPTYPEALIGRGTALAFQRELDAAISDFTKVCNYLAI